MSCVRPPEMTRLDEVKSDDEDTVSEAMFASSLCCSGFLCFTPKRIPQTLEKQNVAPEEPAVSGAERRPILRGLAEGIQFSLRSSVSERRKVYVKPKELICCLLEPKYNPEPCPVCPLQLCLACETLHCHPDYIYHCLLEHPILPIPGEEKRSPAIGYDLDVQRSQSPYNNPPSDLSPNIPDQLHSKPKQIQDPSVLPPGPLIPSEMGVTS